MNIQYTLFPKNNKKNSIIPLFIPFFGCPQICVFCNQNVQTGQDINFNNHKKEVENTSYQSFKESSPLLSQSKTSKNENFSFLLEKAEQDIENCVTTKDKELAFFGGTFSALPEKEFNTALNFIEKLKKQNKIQYARCSTRPDACSLERLEKMKDKGIDTIELGVQSFSNIALTASNRGYTKDCIFQACENVQRKNFALGIQLLPNLPRQSESDFLEDIYLSIRIKPDFMRFYPCLVVEGTKLEKMLRAQEHQVWSYNRTLELLAQALFMAWKANIPVIRIGVAPEESFYAKVLAGVHHPSLGQSVQAMAFKLAFKEICMLHKINPADYIWEFPLAAKGYVFLKKDTFWKEHGIEKNIIWQNMDNICAKIPFQ